MLTVDDHVLVGQSDCEANASQSEITAADIARASGTAVIGGGANVMNDAMTDSITDPAADSATDSAGSADSAQDIFETMNTPLRPCAGSRHGAISVERILKCQLCQQCSKKH